MLRSFVALVVLVGLATAAPAAAASGAISGHVQDLDGNPLADICVTAHAPDAATPFGGPIFTTDDNGDYVITGLAAGAYKVYFFSQRPACEFGDDVYLPQDSTTVSVADGATTPDIDATMAEVQGISGTITDPAGEPIDGICISVHPYDTTDPYGPPAGFSESAPDGHYVIGLPVGRYKVQFFDEGGPCTIGQYAGQWYRDKPDLASADTVLVVAARNTFDVDAVMYEKTTLSGHVQDEAGQPLLGICVVANNNTTLNMPGVVPPFARTDAAGNYRMEIPPGDWVVQFYDGGFPCNVGKYVAQFFNGKPTPELADVVHVARGAHVGGINATMKLFVTPVVTTPVTPPPPPVAVVKCRVPTLRGVTLPRAKRQLKRSHCRLGKVTRRHAPRRMAGRVLRSNPRARSVHPAGTKVALALGERR